jgi:hypothetical protein
MRPAARLIGVTIALAASVAGCGEPNSGAPCPPVHGEFPPVGCAYVRGRLTAGGAPMAGAGVRANLFVNPYGYQYVSDAVATDAQGRFQLVVLRMDSFEPPAVPDTVTLYIKVYSDLSSEQQGVPLDSVPVLMTFAPMGTVVDTTVAELALP